VKSTDNSPLHNNTKMRNSTPETIRKESFGERIDFSESGECIFPDDYEDDIDELR